MVERTGRPAKTRAEFTVQRLASGLAKRPGVFEAKRRVVRPATWPVAGLLKATDEPAITRLVVVAATTVSSSSSTDTRLLARDWGYESAEMPSKSYIARLPDAVSPCHSQHLLAVLEPCDQRQQARTWPACVHARRVIEQRLRATDIVESALKQGEVSNDCRGNQPLSSCKYLGTLKAFFGLYLTGTISKRICKSSTSFHLRLSLSSSQINAHGTGFYILGVDMAKVFFHLPP